jgi:hypothetical protein
MSMDAFRITVLSIALAASPVAACGFVESAGKLPTLREEAVACKVLVYGRLANPTVGPDGKATTELVVTQVLKSDPAIAGKLTLRLPTYLEVPDPANPPGLLAFAVITDGQIDFIRGLPCTPAAADFVAGGMKLDGKDRVGVMAYCADFLEHPDPVVAADAFAEFIKSTDPEIRAVGRAMNAEKLRGWLRSDKTPTDRLRLYTFLLAQCGAKADARLLRDLLDRWVNEKSPPQLDGALTAYTLLDREAGWGYVCNVLADPKKPFIVRYAGLRAIRYFQTTDPDAVSKADRLKAVSLALDHADMADLAVNHLAQWKSWDLTGDVLGLPARPGFDAPIIRRAVIRYALSCTDRKAKEFLAVIRKSDPDLVADTEAWFKTESAEKK